MNWTIRLAGIISLFTAVLHLIGGQLSLVDPLLAGGLDDQIKTEWLGAWHMISAILFFFAYYLLRFGTSKQQEHTDTIRFIAGIYLLFGLAFIGTSIYRGMVAPQFVLFVPVSLLIWIYQRGASNYEIA